MVSTNGRIVYVSREGGLNDIWIMDGDGKNQKQLTANAGNNVHPWVTPDGRYIVFTSTRELLRRSIWRTALLSPSAAQEAGNGNFCRRIVINSRIVGTWKRMVRSNGTILVTTSGFGKLEPPPLIALKAADGIKNFLGSGGTAIKAYSYELIHRACHLRNALFG